MKALRNAILTVVVVFVGLIVLLTYQQAQPGASVPGARIIVPTAIPTEIPLPLSAYSPVSSAELVSYANDHIGDHVWTNVVVFNIIDDNTFQGYFLSTTDAVVVRLSGTPRHLHKGEELIVYGTVAGYASGTNSFGATIKQPEIDDARLN